MAIGKTKKLVVILTVLLIVIGSLLMYRFVDYAVNSCISRDVEIKVYPGDNRDSLIVKLADAVNPKKFGSYYDSYFEGQLKPGAYTLKNGLSERRLLRIIANQYQTPVNVVFNNVSNIPQLAGKVSKCLLVDSLELLKYLLNPGTPKKYSLDAVDFQMIFLPNTYQMYWTATPEQFVDRMYKEYQKFWNEERQKKADLLRLSPRQVYIIASIVDRETIYAPDRTKIAGVYINRIRKGMPLQADPTVKFAVGDPTLKRVLNRHLEVDSPYNTYKYAGLPPGPISMPDGKTIDAVLDYKGHKYLYFCAAADLSGRSEFSSTLAEHNRYAKAYQQQLNKLKIR